MKVLVFGDVVGRPGRRALKEFLPKVREELSPDLILCNGENSAGGFGITLKVYEELKGMGIDVITSGNHIWDKREVFNFIESKRDLLRPLNYPEGVPGRGFIILERKGIRVCILNLMGRVFMSPHLENPFTTFDKFYQEYKREFDLLIVDFHGEATSEKLAFALYCDGRTNLIYGSHTHIPTADETILPKGTAYVTDVGMVGPFPSVIGMREREPVEIFLRGIPKRFEVAKGKVMINALFVEFEGGKVKEIKRIKEFW